MKNTPKTSSSTSAPAVSEQSAWLQFDRVEKVPEILARQILREIVGAGLRPGDMLPPEAMMLERYGVGRASLREGLRILEIHGVLKIKPGPGGGPMVDTVTSSDYGRTMTVFLYSAQATNRELVEARMIIEPVMARLAAERLSEDVATRLRGVLQAGHDAVASPAAEWSVQTGEFHDVISGVSGNRVLDLFGESLVSIQRVRLGPVFPVGKRSATLRAHDRIAKAILSGDGEQAEKFTRSHLQELAKSMEAIMPRMMDEVIDWR